MPELQLVKRVLNGDHRAQREFYDAHVDRVYRLAYRMTGDEERARECTQETFIRAFDRLETFRGDAALSTWIHRVTVSVTLGWIRKHRRHEKREMDLDAGRNVTARAETGDMVDQAISDAIGRLTDVYRTVVIMHDVEGFTHEEIGDALGIAAGTSKVRLSRARAQLRGFLGDFGEEFAK